MKIDKLLLAFCVAILSLGLLGCGDEEESCTENQIAACGEDEGGGQKKCLPDGDWTPCGNDFCNVDTAQPAQCNYTAGTCTVVGQVDCEATTGRLSDCKPPVELCNGVDDDCDGQVDEEFAEAGQTCTSECGDGTWICEAGAKVCQGGGTPTAEICDDKDNDCNGNVDEGCDDDHDGFCDKDLQVVGNPTVCTLGVGDCDDSDKAINPDAAEVCNDKDDNCDDKIDDIDDLIDCVPKSEECETVQIPACKAGKAQTSADCTEADLTKGAEPEADFECDEKDNNCDGNIDEGQECCEYDKDDPPVKVCGTNDGECQKGVLVCQEDNTWAEECGGADYIGPVDEICDGKDNDCNKETDETFENKDKVCGSDIGECVAGTYVCVEAQEVCQGEIGATDEVCDGKDNDCNEIVDDGLGTDANEGAGGNDTCSVAKDIGILPENADPFAPQDPTTLYKDGQAPDVDWYKINAKEESNWPCGWNPFAWNECYEFFAEIEVPEGVDYELCVQENSCELGDEDQIFCSDDGGAGMPEVVGIGWNGFTAANDSRDLYISVKGKTDADMSCVPYELLITFIRSCPNDGKCPWEEGYVPDP